LQSAELGNLSQVQSLLDADKLKDLVAEVNTRSCDPNKWHALHCATYHGHLTIIDFLIKQPKIDLNPLTEPMKLTCLHLAA
jgi:ankyrin repeat protein